MPVLAQCPNLMATFDAQLSARLIAWMKITISPWIMKKREHKKEVFGLFFTVRFLLHYSKKKICSKNSPGYLLLYAKLMSWN